MGQVNVVNLSGAGGSKYITSAGPHTGDFYAIQFLAATQIDALEEASYDLEAAVGRDPLAREGDRKLPSTSANLALRYPHPCGPPVW